MSILSTLKAIGEDQKKRITNVAETFKAIGSNIAHGKILTGVPVAKKYEGTLLGNVATNLTKPITLAAAAVGPLAVKSGLVATVAKAAVANPVKAVQYTAVGTVAAGVLSKSNKPIEVLKSTPSKLYEAGSDIGETLEGKKSVLATIKENPEVAIAGAVAVGVGTAAAATNLYKGFKEGENTKALKEATETIKSTVTEKIISSLPSLPQTVPAVATPAAIEAASPTATPEAAVISKPKKKKKAKKKAKKKTAKKKASKKKKTSKKATKRKTAKKSKQKAKSIKKRNTSKKAKKKK